MEIHSFETYIDALVANFKDSDFAPENASKIPSALRKKISIDSPYWQPLDVNNTSGETFYVEFKKYGQNRKRVFLRFSFEPPLTDNDPPRKLALALVDDELNELDGKEEVIELSSIWKNNSVLVDFLKKYVKRGLELAEEKNN